MNKNGLLIPGDPAQGVVRYQGKFYVFANERGIGDFIANPQRYTQGMCRRMVCDCHCVRQASVPAGVLSSAKRSPELVHLLQLQAYFPQASIAGILRGVHGDSRAGPASGAALEASLKASGSSAYDDAPAPGAIPKTRDAATETPTHFVERHIDPR